MQQFTLDARLEADTYAICDLPLSAVRLMRDANYAWLLLAPRRPEVTEIVDLTPDEQAQLMTEIRVACAALRASVPCDKLNVAALGNRVAQLHIHVIARRRDDPAWPEPVWGNAPPQPYAEGRAQALVASLAAHLVSDTVSAN